MQTSFEQLLGLVKAGASVVHIASYEWERVQGWSIALASDLSVPLRIWSHSLGLQLCDEDGKRREEDATLRSPTKALRNFTNGEEGYVLLLEDVHPFFKDHELVRWIREVCRLRGRSARLLILSTPLPGLPVELRKEVPTLELPLPGVKDLRVVAENVAEELDVPFDEQATELLEGARGLTVMEAKLAFAQAAARFRELGPAAVSSVVKEKERVIRQSEVLEYYDPDARMNDVGGLDNLKTWLERRGRAFGAGAREWGLDAPKGVMLLGVQGCGKSLLAKAIATMWQFPLLRFDMGKVFGGIVGQSEGNMRAALQVAQALAPCVLWIDEIEKGLAGMGSSDRTDGGTTARVVGTFLTWMQEKSEPVFVVATANRIDMLPPELLRKGRFDELFFVDLPTHAVRKEIVRIHLEKKGRNPADFDLEKLADLSRGYSGAELEEAVREGLFDAFSEGRGLRTEHIAAAIEATFPLSRTMKDEIEHLRMWARARARLASAEEPEPLPVPPNDGARTPIPRLRQESRNPFIPGTDS